MRIIEVEIDAEMIVKAERLAAEQPPLADAIRDGEGAVYGSADGRRTPTTTTS